MLSLNSRDEYFCNGYVLAQYYILQVMCGFKVAD